MLASLEHGELPFARPRVLANDVLVLIITLHLEVAMVRGAFTGAVSDRTGLIELAHGGSLLLDEIGEIPASLQVKLLRVLQDREFRAVGGSRVMQPNFRLICATNVDLDAALHGGKIREDLHFRINTVMLAVPPLRDRADDILLLAEHFLDRFSTKHQRDIHSIKPDAAKALLRYRWPGNVRELEHVVERAVIVADGADITFDDLPSSIQGTERLPSQSGFVIPPRHTLAEIEKLAILQTLERTRGNKRKAARILGVYRPTLYSKLKKYNLMETHDHRAAPPPWAGTVGPDPAERRKTAGEQASAEGGALIVQQEPSHPA